MNRVDVLVSVGWVMEHLKDPLVSDRPTLGLC